MSERSRTEDVVFQRPFRLPGHGGAQPAGTYRVDTEEALIEGLSFNAWQRTGTTITRRATRAGETLQALAVTPADLAEALRIDGLPAPPGP